MDSIKQGLDEFQKEYGGNDIPDSEIEKLCPERELVRGLPGYKTMDIAAGKWAAYCIMTLRGDTLEAGLKISKAIAEFLDSFVGEKGDD